MTTETEKLVQREAETSEVSRGLNDHLLEGKGRRRGQAKAKMLTLRLSASDHAEIERVAQELDIPVSALVRGWILDGLAEQRGTSVPDAVDRLAAEVDRLRRKIGR